MLGVEAFKSWIEHDVGRSWLELIFSLSGCSTVDAMDKLAELYKLQPELSIFSKDEIHTQMSRRDQYRLVSSLKLDKSGLIAKGSSRFTEGKMKASLIYFEQQFDVQEEEGGRETVTIPFLYERHTSLVFSTLVTELSQGNRMLFIAKTIQALQSGMISPYQEKIEIENLFIPKKALQNMVSVETHGLDASKKEIAESLKFKGFPLAKKFQIRLWDTTNKPKVIELNYTAKKLHRQLSLWIRILNQKELDSIAAVTNREPRFKVKMKKLFPEIKKVAKPSIWKSWNPGGIDGVVG